MEKWDEDLQSRRKEIQGPLGAHQGPDSPPLFPRLEASCGNTESPSGLIGGGTVVSRTGYLSHLL